MAWHLTKDAEDFWSAAGSFLRSRPVENSLPLTLIDTLRARNLHYYGSEDPFFGWYESAGDVLGRMPADAAPPPDRGGRPGSVHELAGATAGRSPTARSQRNAVTSAVTQAALDAGAEDVVLGLRACRAGCLAARVTLWPRTSVQSVSSRAESCWDQVHERKHCPFCQSGCA